VLATSSRALLLLGAWACAAAVVPAQGARAAESAGPRFFEERDAIEPILALADERLALMPGVAAFKWQHHTPVSDPPRERAVIEHAVMLAEPLGLSADGVRRFFELQIQLANEVESQLHERWRTRGFDYTQAVPNLTSEVRPQLDRLTGELLSALYLAAPELERADFATRYESLAAQRLHAQGWSPAARTRLLEALAAVRSDGSPSLARITAVHVLRIGTTGDYAPFSLESGGRLTGADIELALALAQHLGVTARFVRTSWQRLLEDLRGGRFDIALGGVSDTPERRAVAAVSPGYYHGGKTIIARCDATARLGSLAALDRPSVRLIVNPGGTNEQFVRQNLTHAAVRVFPDNRAIFDELVGGRADAMITDDTEVELQVRRHPQLCRAYPGTLTRADKVILMARDPGLDAAIDAWLEAQIAMAVPTRLLGSALASESSESK
jgi:cyclohexadienyl dehydratase